MKVLRQLLNLAVWGTIIAAVTYFVAIPTVTALQMPDDIRLTREEIESRQSVSPNRYVDGVYDRAATVDDVGRTWVDLKLFGLVKVKRVMVDVMPYDRVLAGGVPVGFSAKTDGVIVLQDGGGYKKGDIITRLDGKNITSVEDLDRHLGGRSLGLWVKDETSGVGMLTYINPDNNNFAALGHKLVDFETGAGVNLRAGDVYACNVIGIEKSDNRKIGEYQVTLRKGTDGVQGSVLSSNSRGVFGCLNDNSILLKKCTDIYPVASRYSVKPGKAQVLMTLDGGTVQSYDIEIVKARYQKKQQEKGLIIRITDKELLKNTGGIVHGMSGSPIIQNGKLVGAVTHVMVGDVKMGYGIYIDFVMP